MENDKFKEMAEEFAGLGLTLPEDTFGDISTYKDVWSSLSMVDSPKAKPLQDKLREVICDKYRYRPSDVEPVHEGFAFGWFWPRDDGGQELKGEELRKGCSYSDTMLDINELCDEYVAHPGDKIDLTNFPNVHTLQISSQKQLDMLTEESKKQITSIHLSNNTRLDWGDFYARNEKPMDKTLDLTAYKNLKTVEAHCYLNNDLRAIKLPETTQFVFLQRSCLPKLNTLGLKAKVFANSALTQQGDSIDLHYHFDYPKNRQEAEALFEDVAQLGGGKLPLHKLVDDKGDSRCVFDLIEEYPDLAPKAAQSLEAYPVYFDYHGDLSDRKHKTMLEMFDIPTADGRTVVEAYPEVAVSYYKEMLNEEYDFDFSEMMSFARDYPVVTGLVAKEVKDSLKQGKSPNLLDLAFIGAADSSHTKKICQILERMEGGDLYLQRMVPYQKTAAAEYVKLLSKEKPADQKDFNDITREVSYVVSDWPEFAAFAYKALEQVAKRGAKQNNGKPFEVSEEVFGKRNIELANRQKPTNLAEQHKINSKINNTKLLRKSKEITR